MATLHAFRAADRQVGGGHLYTTVTGYLQAALAPRLFGSRVAEGHMSVFTAAGGFTEMAGWMARDAGHDQGAQRHFRRSLDLAHMGGDSQLSAHVYASLSHLSLHLGEPSDAISLARQGHAALNDLPLAPELSARLFAMEARGLAVMSRSTACTEALSRAEKALDRSPTEAPSPWVSPFDAGSLASETARCTRQLGQLGEAERQARRIIELRAGSHTRSRAFAKLLLVTVLIAQGKPDEACIMAREVVDTIQGLSSHLVTQQLHELHALLEPYRTTPTVAEFLPCLEDAVRGRLGLYNWLGSDANMTGRAEVMSAKKPLYERDPEAWRAHLAEGNATQPRKRVGADVLIRDAGGRLLLVDPKYKPDWDLPGGMSEANEPPAETVRRELKEELGLDLHPGALLCVDWVSPHGPWDDSLMFIFDGGVLDEQRIASLSPHDDELGGFAFCTEDEVDTRLRPYVLRRTRGALAALRTGCAVYLQDGRESSH